MPRPRFATLDSFELPIETISNPVTIIAPIVPAIVSIRGAAVPLPLLDASVAIAIPAVAFPLFHSPIAIEI